ncbi:MAG: hypothetical protein AAF726_22675 [Planctomycetota bacterium]
MDDRSDARALPARLLEDLDAVFYSRRLQSVSPRRCFVLVGATFALGFAGWAALDPALRRDIAIVASTASFAPLLALIAFMWIAAGIGLLGVVDGLRLALGVRRTRRMGHLSTLRASLWVSTFFVLTLLVCVLLELGFIAAFGTPREFREVMACLREVPHFEARFSLLHVPVVWASTTLAVPLAVLGEGALHRRLT